MATIEAALIQRARLLDAVLSDLYGDKQLLRDGVIPAELVFSDPRLPAAPATASSPMPEDLHFYAIDLARDADGSWRVIDNHTETPAGVGYALANRVVHTHVAGDLFEACNGVRLASFFQRLQTDLTMLTGRRDPRIALMTPGPHHDDYFSHAYLARYLGYLLVEGGDLRTAGDRLFLKTLEGLKRIDLIVRCVDGRHRTRWSSTARATAVRPVWCRPAARPRRWCAMRSARRWRRTAASAPTFHVCRHLFGEDLSSPTRRAGGSATPATAARHRQPRRLRRPQRPGRHRPAGRRRLGREMRALTKSERAPQERRSGSPARGSSPRRRWASACPPHSGGTA